MSATAAAHHGVVKHRGSLDCKCRTSSSICREPWFPDWWSVDGTKRSVREGRLGQCPSTLVRLCSDPQRTLSETHSILTCVLIRTRGRYGQTVGLNPVSAFEKATLKALM
jgi:hypothetical protein